MATAPDLERVAVRLTGPNLDLVQQAPALIVSGDGVNVFSVEEGRARFGSRLAERNGSFWELVQPSSRVKESQPVEEIAVYGIDDPICVFLDGRPLEEGSWATVEWDYGPRGETVILLDGQELARFAKGCWQRQDRHGNLAERGERLILGAPNLFAASPTLLDYVRREHPQETARIVEWHESHDGWAPKLFLANPVAFSDYRLGRSSATG